MGVCEGEGLVGLARDGVRRGDQGLGVSVQVAVEKRRTQIERHFLVARRPQSRVSRRA